MFIGIGSFAESVAEQPAKLEVVSDTEYYDHRGLLDDSKLIRLDERLKQEVSEVFESLLGAPLPETGVVHVAAVGIVDGRRLVLKINEQTPKSPLDYYFLNAVRVWADVVLTSGAIVRDEPSLSFKIDGPNDGVRSVLRKVRGIRPPLEVAVLSSGRGLASALERLGTTNPVTLLNSSNPDPALVGAELPPGVRQVTQSNAGPREFVEWARCSNGRTGRRVSVELGPSTSAALYRSPCLVDRLVLGEYLGSVSEEVQGGAFLEAVDLKSNFAPMGDWLESDDWRFRQYGRRLQQ